MNTYEFFSNIPAVFNVYLGTREVVYSNSRVLSNGNTETLVLLDGKDRIVLPLQELVQVAGTPQGAMIYSVTDSLGDTYTLKVTVEKTAYLDEWQDALDGN